MASSDSGGAPSRGTASVPSYGYKSAYGVLVAMAVTIPLGVGFFQYGGIFGPLSDVGGLAVGLLVAPLVWCTYLLHEDADGNRGLLAVGGVAVATNCVGSFGLIVLSLLSMENQMAAFLGVQFLGWLLFGGWLVGAGLLGRRAGTMGERTAWTAIAAGVGAAGGMVTLVYSYAVGSFTPLFGLFMLVFAVGFLTWAFLYGGELRERAASEPTSDDSASRPRV